MLWKFVELHHTALSGSEEHLETWTINLILRMPTATFNHPSVSYQSLLSLIIAVTGCHVPVVFSHISSSPIFCKGGQSKSLLTLTEAQAPLQHNKIGFFQPSEQRTAPVPLRLLLEVSTKDSTTILFGVQPPSKFASTKLDKTTYHRLIYAHTV